MVDLPPTLVPTVAVVGEGEFLPTVPAVAVILVVDVVDNVVVPRGHTNTGLRSAEAHRIVLEVPVETD
jgi:hypothetical protein